MLVLTRKPNQSVQIGDQITVRVIRIKGNSIQLGIEAPRQVNILRSELRERKDADGEDNPSNARESGEHDHRDEAEALISLGIFRAEEPKSDDDQHRPELVTAL